jgi:hypothetical protein
MKKSTKSRRATSAAPHQQTAATAASMMSLPPQVAPVMRGHDRGKAALPPSAGGLDIGQSALPCATLCALLPAPYNSICQALCPIIP